MLAYPVQAPFIHTLLGNERKTFVYLKDSKATVLRTRLYRKAVSGDSIGKFLCAFEDARMIDQ